MRLTANFSLDEFKCNDGTQVPEHLMDNVIALAEALQVLRDEIGLPIHINSAYRTPAYNLSVGGSKRSQHLVAKAADIVARGMSPTEVREIIERLISEGKMPQGGLGKYDSFTHYDIRGTKARW